MSGLESSNLLTRRSRRVQSGADRAAVLGANDGLVSVLCLVLGVAGAGATPGMILLAGFAGLIAGAVSMAAGEWVSVSAQAQLLEGILTSARRLAETDRQLMIDQIADRLADEGCTPATARVAAREIAEDKHFLVDTYARQVMGFNPHELGSPWWAAISSLLLFSVGALTPLIPWFFSGGAQAVLLSIVFTATASVIIGSYIASSSGKQPVYGALRQLFIVALASGVTYGIGLVFGVAVS